MMVRIRLVLPTLLALASCASTPSPVATDVAGPVVQTSAAPPQRVIAVSNELGQRLDSMLANARLSSASVTR